MIMIMKKPDFFFYFLVVVVVDGPLSGQERRVDAYKMIGGNLED